MPAIIQRLIPQHGLHQEYRLDIKKELGLVKGKRACSVGQWQPLSWYRGHADNQWS